MDDWLQCNISQFFHLPDQVKANRNGLEESYCVTSRGKYSGLYYLCQKDLVLVKNKSEKREKGFFRGHTNRRRLRPLHQGILLCQLYDIIDKVGRLGDADCDVE